VIAALFVQTNGCYFNLEGVDPWDEKRDARKYVGPYPVVAHPPCERWGRYAGARVGQDAGCFASALVSVRAYGGVLEHPEGSHAWRAYGLNCPPRSGGWVVADEFGGWTCCVAQGYYGHRARKLTWLYACRAELPALRWGEAKGEFVLPVPEGANEVERKRLIRIGICQRLSKNQRAATPKPFRELLISIARSARATL
jgi:hypothetical protein